MRIHLRDIGQAKKLAKRLKTISEQADSRSVSKLSLSRCQQIVAYVLGYRDWHELAEETAKTHEPSPDDRDISHDDMIARRRYQGARLVELGFNRHTAAALVDSLLPSGNPEREREAIAARPERKIESTSDLPPETVQRYLAEPAYNAALGDVLTDRGLSEDMDGIFDAHLILAERMRLGFDPRRLRRQDTASQGKRERHDTQVSAKGYLGVIVPERNFYQGFHIIDMGEEVRRDIRSRQVDALRHYGEAVNHESLSGMLQAVICELALNYPERTRQLAIFCDLLAEHENCNYVLVIARHLGHGGYGTDLERLHQVHSLAEARKAMEAHPETRAIQDRVGSAIKGLHPDFDNGS